MKFPHTISQDKTFLAQGPCGFGACRAVPIYIAVARICVTAMISGVPVGVQIAWLLCTTSGWPFDNTLTDPLGGIQVAFTHGPLATAGGGNAQPATR